MSVLFRRLTLSAKRKTKHFFYITKYIGINSTIFKLTLQYFFIQRGDICIDSGYSVFCQGKNLRKIGGNRVFIGHFHGQNLQGSNYSGQVKEE